MPDNIECPDRITRHSEVALASFVQIADDLPVTGHRLSRTVLDTDGGLAQLMLHCQSAFSECERYDARGQKLSGPWTAGSAGPRCQQAPVRP